MSYTLATRSLRADKQDRYSGGPRSSAGGERDDCGQSPAPYSFPLTGKEIFFLTKVILCIISFLDELESLCFLAGPRNIKSHVGSLKEWADWKPQLRRLENCQVPQNHGDKKALPVPVCEHWEGVVRACTRMSRRKGGIQCRLQSRCWIVVQTSHSKLLLSRTLGDC